MGSTPAFPGLPADTLAKTIANGDSTNFVDVFTAPAAPDGNGVLIGRIRATSDDTNAVTVQFARKVSGTDYPMGEVQIPAGSGTNGSAAWVDVTAQVFAGVALTLKPGEILRAKAKTAVTSAKFLYLTGEVAPL